MDEINKNLTDNELVGLVQATADNEALKELINRHSGIFVSVCKKHSQSLPSGKFFEDLFDSKDFVIYDAAKSYDGTKGSKFSTWLANQTRYYCLNTLAKENKYVHCDEEQIENFFDAKSKDFFLTEGMKSEQKEKVERIREILDNLESESIRRVITEKYFSEDSTKVTFTEIAHKMNVSVQTVINWHQKFVSFARNKLTNT